MYLRRGPFRWSWRCADAIRSKSPDAAWPGLYLKPLDAAIGRLLAPYRPGGRQGDNQHSDNAKYSHFDGHFDGDRDAAVLYPAHCPMDLFVAFIKATKHRHQASTRSDIVKRSIKFRLFFDFITKSLKKSSSCPNNNRGVTYQSDGKDLADGVEYLHRGAKLVC
jgi:hypothetical protein